MSSGTSVGVVSLPTDDLSPVDVEPTSRDAVPQGPDKSEQKAPSSWMFSMCKTANTARVRDGYISESTRGAHC
jgi:hypothetical protein